MPRHLVKDRKKFHCFSGLILSMTFVLIWFSFCFCLVCYGIGKIRKNNFAIMFYGPDGGGRTPAHFAHSMDSLKPYKLFVLYSMCAGVPPFIQVDDWAVNLKIHVC